MYILILPTEERPELGKIQVDYRNRHREMTPDPSKMSDHGQLVVAAVTFYLCMWCDRFKHGTESDSIDLYSKSCRKSSLFMP